MQLTSCPQRVPCASVHTAQQRTGIYLITSVDAVLPANPYAGRPGRVEGTRELVVHESDIVAYEVTDAVYILTVRHSARLWPERL